MADSRSNDNIHLQAQLMGTAGVVNSIIGEGTRFSGEFDLEGLLRIDGDFQGRVRTKGRVLVGRNGRAECIIDAATVVIGGAFSGEIRASDRVVVLSTGLVLGSIETPRLVMEEGVLFNGTCSVEPGVNREGGVDGSAVEAGSADQPPADGQRVGDRDFRIVKENPQQQAAAGGSLGH